MPIFLTVLSTDNYNVFTDMLNFYQNDCATQLLVFRFVAFKILEQIKKVVDKGLNVAHVDSVFDGV